uniref:NADH-ubiquinone oxidoreductase chain 5 n=1 Tax=Malawimonas californiana TaxID=221722 RepID=A0A0B5GCN3_MALCL|nr:NADH dehydrogenase subunit 5 [Malawimonas californiana]AJF22851.1 NADH dehydrogenase subunit 5 [Malawimonas californiana]
MYLTILMLPIISALFTGLLGRNFGNRGSQIITVACLGISAVLSTIAFYEVGILGSVCYIIGFKWIESDLLNLNYNLIFDSLTVVMLVVVTLIATLVTIYSIGYMSEDSHISRFFTYLAIFTFAMLILVTSNNFLQMFIGWEGVGVSSYLLINFWYTRIQANKAAIKAMVVNRVGDFGLIIGIMAIYYVFRSIDFSIVFSSAYYIFNFKIIFLNMEFDAVTIIGLLLFVGAIGKSAQIGLHTWLPDAMEGPTPVSALIHAATMVTAGVFMIIRCSPLLEFSHNLLITITFIGAITAFFAAITGVAQNDLKRVIAYSTCSQLGYMVFACGISSYSVSLFHLMNHAFFKALLFLSAGSVIHAISDEQDMRKMGGLVKIIPFTYTLILIGSLSLMGIPFLTGFYSKDVILELAYANYHIHSNLSYWLGTISALFTSFYSFRLIILTFFNRTNALRFTIENMHDAPIVMIIPLVILVIGSIFIGYITKDMIIGMGTNFWGNSLFSLPQNIYIFESEFIPYYIKLIPVLFSITGAFMAFIFYIFFMKTLYKMNISSIGISVYTYLNKKLFFDILYNEFIVKKLYSFGYNISFKLIDRGIIEIIGPYGLSSIVLNLTSKLTKFQTGYIYHYIFVIFIGVVTIITLILFNPCLYIDFRYIIIWIIVIFLGYFY